MTRDLVEPAEPERTPFTVDLPKCCIALTETWTSIEAVCTKTGIISTYRPTPEVEEL